MPRSSFYIRVYNFIFTCHPNFGAQRVFKILVEEIFIIKISRSLYSLALHKICVKFGYLVLMQRKNGS